MSPINSNMNKENHIVTIPKGRLRTVSFSTDVDGELIESHLVEQGKKKLKVIIVDIDKAKKSKVAIVKGTKQSGKVVNPNTGHRFLYRV